MASFDSVCFVVCLCVVGPVVGGCAPRANELRVDGAFDGPVLIAVAPVLNFTGEQTLDGLAAADLLASEMTYAPGVTVLPVSRVAALLESQGKRHIESPEHARRVTEALGADGMIVAGITEYDAYTPTVGVIIQLYMKERRLGRGGVDPVTSSRLTTDGWKNEPNIETTEPENQIQRTYCGGHEDVADAVKRFASGRTAEKEPLGWRKYLKIQSQFLRFCWHDSILRLMKQRRDDAWFDRVAAEVPEERP